MPKVEEFEREIARFFGAPYCVATDSCTSAVELCLRLKKATHIVCPKHTYVSIPMLAEKLRIALLWNNENWKEYYNVYANIFDAAVLFRKDSYISGTMMCVSFQYAKHLSVGRLGCILLDTYLNAELLRKMRYDGREPDKPWREQDIEIMGFHYYPQPELCQIGLDKLDEAIATQPKKWTVEDYPDISKFKVFQ